MLPMLVSGTARNQLSDGKVSPIVSKTITPVITRVRPEGLSVPRVRRPLVARLVLCTDILCVSASVMRRVSWPPSQSESRYAGSSVIKLECVTYLSVPTHKRNSGL